MRHKLLVLSLAAPATAWVLPTLLQAQEAPKAIISSVQPACVEAGGSMTVLGVDFNARLAASNRLRLVAVLDRRRVYTLTTTRWTDRSITATLPNDVFSPGRSYAIGLRNQYDLWASNTDRQFHVCNAPEIDPIGSGQIAPAEESVEPPSPQSGQTPAQSLPSSDGRNVPVLVDESMSISDSSNLEGDAEYDAPAPEAGLVVMPESGGSGGSSSMGSLDGPRVDADEDPDLELGELLTAHADISEARAFDERVSEHSGRLVRRRSLNGIGLVVSTYRFASNRALRDAMTALGEGFGGLAIDVNSHFQLLASDADQAGRRQLQLVKWSSALSACGRKLRIGMLDTGLYTSHAALLGRNISQRSFLPGGMKAADQNHGTAIATLLVGNPGVPGFGGLLPEAELYAGGVFRQNGKRTVSTAEWLALGLDWLVLQKVSVINLSLGGVYNKLVELALSRVIGLDIKVVAAAGIDGKRGEPLYPAYMPGVVAVAAVDMDLKPGRKNPQGTYISFAAPGIDVWAGDDKGGGRYYSGSSYAAPFVTAALAASGPQGYADLARAARDLGDKGRDPVFGWGLVQFLDACGRHGLTD